MIDNIDRIWLESDLDLENIYQNIVKIIEKINSIIYIYDNASMGDIIINPINGNIIFGSSLMGWVFSLKNFALIYSKKFGIDQAEMIDKLWGEWFFDNEEGDWKKHNTSENGKALKRTFNQFVIEPIQRLAKAVIEINEEDNEGLVNTLNSLGIEFNIEDKDSNKVGFLKKIIQQWLDVDECLLEMIIQHLPSPKASQRYRVDYLYEGPLDDECATAMRNCDLNGPLMIYISKIIPSKEMGRCYAFGRVFSGTVAAGQKVRIMGPNFVAGKKDDLYVKSIQRTVLMMGRSTEHIPDVPCGNIVGLVGVDAYLTKTGTISTHEDAHAIKNMKYSVSSVVRVSVKPKKMADLPRFLDRLKWISKVDPFIQCSLEETGDHTITGNSYLHLQAAINDFIEHTDIEIIQSAFFVAYKETIQSISYQVCMAKSPNKHNRLYATAEPLEKDLLEKIELGTIGPKIQPESRSKILQDGYNWDKNDAKKIWAFGPEKTKANIIINATAGVQNIHEIKDSVESGFEWAVLEGCMTQENMRGIRFNLIDACLHADSIHRGGGQIIPTSRKVFYGAFLTAKPALQEPIFFVEIHCPTNVLGIVYQCLHTRRGIINTEEIIQGTQLTLVKGFLPVAESFDFTEELKYKTSGQALSTYIFDHWSIVP